MYGMFNMKIDVVVDFVLENEMARKQLQTN